MRVFLIVLAVAGILVSSLALVIHDQTYVEDVSGHATSHWNSGEVNHSPYSAVHGIPVALIGIAGYAALGVLAFYRRRALTAIGSLLALAYSLYLTNIEAHILELWCVYCVTSLLIVILIVFAAFGQLIEKGEPGV